MTWPTLPAGLTPGFISIFTGLLLLFGIIVKAWPANRKVNADSDASLRGDLLARVTVLEERLSTVTIRLEVERTNHEAEMQIMRLRLNNETTSLDALLMLLKNSPDRVSDAVIQIEEMRARREALILAEYAAMAAAKVGPNGPSVPAD